MREEIKKFMSLMLSVLFVFSGISVFDTFVETVIADEGVPELIITGLGTDGPVAYVNYTNTLELSIANIGTADAMNVAANVYDVIPNQNETLIKTVHFGALDFDELKANNEKTHSFDWIPDQTGSHYIKVEITGRYLTHNSPPESVNITPVTLSSGFPVVLAGPEERWGPGGPGAGYHDYNIVNLTNDPTGIRYRDGPMTILLFDSLIIESGATLQLNESVTLIMMNTYAGEFGINISSGATFIIDSSPTTPTSIQTPTSPIEKFYTYPFHNAGTIDFTGASVSYTHGDKTNTANPGGIQNHAGSVCNLTDCEILWADSHSLMASDSELNVGGLATTTIGTHDENTNTNKGTGITLIGNTAASISGITADNNEEYGIKCVNTENQVRIENGATIKNGKSHGIWLENSDAVITDSFVMDNAGDGIVCRGGSNAQIEGNTIEWNNKSGIDIENSKPVIKNNTAIQWNGAHGINVKNINGDGAKIEGNCIENNFGSGIWCEDAEVLISNNTISSNGQSLIYRSDMESESDRNNWTTTGIWHPVNNESGSAPSWNISHSGDWSWWFGNDTEGNYSGLANEMRTLFSPTIDLTGKTSASLVFWSWYETDGASDQRSININGNSSQLAEGEMREWTRHVIDLSEFVGGDVDINFTFWPDFFGNDCQGWYIDDVEIIGSYPAIEGHGIQYTNSNLAIINNTISTNNWDGISGSSSSSPLINNNTIDSKRNGIYIHTSTETIIEWNHIGSTGAISIYIHTSTSTKIRNNTFQMAKNTPYAISIWYGSENIISDNNVNGYSDLNSNRYIDLNYATSKNMIVNNNFVNASSIGIIIDYLSHSNIVANNHIQGEKISGRNGILIRDSSYNDINNNSISGYEYQISIIARNYDSYNNKICNNTVYDGIKSYYGAGIRIFYDDYNNPKIVRPYDNYILGNDVSGSRYGIFSQHASNNYIMHNYLHHNQKPDVDAGTGIRLYEDCDNFTISNNNVSFNEVGIALMYSSHYNKVLNNSVYSNTVYGLHSEHGASYNIWDNNTVGGTKNTAIVIEFIGYGPPVYDIISNNTIIGYVENDILSGRGIKISNSRTSTPYPTVRDSNYVYIYNNTIRDISRGMNFVYSENNTIEHNRFINCTEGIRVESSSNNIFINNSQEDVITQYYLSQSNITSLNSTVDDSKVTFTDKNSVHNVQWFMDVCVVNDAFAPVPDASVWIKDTFGNPVISSNTLADGWIKWTITTEYVQNQTTITNYTAHNITASNATLTGWATPEPFMDESKEVYVVLGEGKIYSIPIHEGWNLISLPYEPMDMSATNILEVLKSIDGKWTIAKWWDTLDYMDPWKIYSVNSPGLSDLNHINHTMGFWLYATESCTLYNLGCPQATTDIRLYDGWNMIGYPTINSSTNISTAFASIDAFRDYPIEGSDPASPTSLIQLPEDYIMQAGEGYWIHVNADCIWTVDW